MRLNTHDEIQVDGIHPTNPVTGVSIPSFLQTFVVTRDQEGDTLDPTALHPRCPEYEPIQMARIRSINMQRIW